MNAQGSVVWGYLLYGLPAHRIDRAAEIAPALEAAISSGAPNLIEIPISSS